jgi:formylglycine-generating enzyme required for sulfatase activity
MNVAESKFCEICGTNLSVARARFAATNRPAQTTPPIEIVSPVQTIVGSERGADEEVPQAEMLTTTVTDEEEPDSLLSVSSPLEVDVSELDMQPSSKKLMVIGIVAGMVLLLVTMISVGSFLYWRSRQKAAVVKPVPSPSPVVSSLPVAPEGMVLIPGGVFEMGRADGDEYESPPHLVTVKPFFMDKNEVTCGEYEKFVQFEAHRAPPGWSQGRCPEGKSLLPVTGVSWNDAQAYAQWAHKRLPSEEEWEFAARGKDHRVYAWGNEWKPLANAGESSSGKLIEVGSYAAGAGPFGTLDMMGNAWEWTSSPLRAYPGAKIKEESLPEVEQEKLKVIRGGSYQSNSKQATTTYRMGWPSEGASSYAQSGFRCASDLDH